MNTHWINCGPVSDTCHVQHRTTHIITLNDDFLKLLAVSACQCLSRIWC